jgi:hypothetical protein
MAEKKELLLPELDEISPITGTWPRDLIVISLPKMGKGSIFGDFTKKRKALVFDLEKGGYDYIEARKVSTYPEQSTTRWEAYQNYIKYRKALLEQKGKYEFLLVDGLTDLDDLSEIGGTLTYMSSIIGSSFNRELDVTGKPIKGGTKLEYGHPDWKSVLTLPDGNGYQHTRKWFLDQIEYFKQISPYRIYAAHVIDKMIKENGKDEVVGSEISLTGRLKTIFASKVTALAKLIADGNERYLNFDVVNDSIIAGSRAPHLHGKILISKKEKGEIKTYWENIYN